MEHSEARLNPNAFIYCFLAGTAGIIFLKFLGLSQFIVTACPVAIMFAYAVAMWRSRRVQFQGGDNLYYLGLLYTLVSLAYSLFEFTPSGDNTESVTPIITNFGIAIFTTILGVAFRVYFGLSYETLDEIEEVARIKLADAAYNLRIQLGEATRDFSMFRLEMQQIIKDGLNETNEVIEKDLRHCLSQFNAAATRFAERIHATDTSLDKERRKLQTNLEVVSDSVSKLATRINSIQISEDLIERILDPPIEQIEKGAERIGSAGDALVARLNNIRVPTTELERSMQQAVESFLAKVQDNLRVEFRKGTQEFEEIFDAFFREIQATREGLETGGHNMHASVDALVATITNLSKRFERVQVPVDLAKTLLHPSVESIEDTADKINAAGKKLTDKFGSVLDIADELERGIHKIVAALSEVPKKERSWIRKLFKPLLRK